MTEKSNDAEIGVNEKHSGSRKGYEKGKRMGEKVRVKKFHLQVLLSGCQGTRVKT